MFTMSPAQIKRLLRENRKRRVRPWALKHIADDLGRSRSMVTTAVKNPQRYPAMRAHIERVLVESVSGTTRRGSTAAKIAVNDPAA